MVRSPDISLILLIIPLAKMFPGKYFIRNDNMK
jgi:hypothetical protein